MTVILLLILWFLDILRTEIGKSLSMICNPSQIKQCSDKSPSLLGLGIFKHSVFVLMIVTLYMIPAM